MRLQSDEGPCLGQPPEVVAELVIPGIARVEACLAADSNPFTSGRVT
jgi:hypothetical protein